MKTGKLTLLFILIFTISCTLAAEKYTGDIFDTGFGARLLGLGSTGVVSGNDPSTIYWNPANSNNIKNISSLFMHSERFKGIVKNDALSIVFPNLEEGYTYGAAIVRTGVSGIKYTEMDSVTHSPVVTKKEDYSNYIVYLSYSSRSTKFDYGFSVKLFKNILDGIDSFGLGLDARIRYDITDNFKVGCNVRNLVPAISFYEDDTEIAVPKATFGAAYSYIIESEDFTSISFTIEDNLDTYFEGREMASDFNLGGVSFDNHAGLEMGFADKLFLRFGMDRDNPTFGAGLSLWKFDLDYALLLHNDLDETHRISINYIWGDNE